MNLMDRLEKTAAGEMTPEEIAALQQQQQQQQQQQPQQQPQEQVQQGLSDEELEAQIARLEASRTPMPEDLGFSGSDVGGAIGAGITGGVGGGFGMLGGAASQEGNFQHAFEKAPLRLAGAPSTHSFGSRAGALGKGVGGTLLGMGAGMLAGSIPGNIVGSSAGALVDNATMANHDQQSLNATIDNYGVDRQIDELQKQQQRQGAGSVSNAPAGFDQSASEDLMDRLEKTAFSLAGFGDKAKNFVGNASGSNFKKAKGTFDSANTAEAVERKFKKGTPIAQQRQNLEILEGKANEAKSNTTKARKQLGVGAGVGATGLAGAAGANSLSKNEQEKSASTTEDFMNEMYKEAATAIIDEVIPQIKTHVDPIDRITFRR